MKRLIFGILVFVSALIIRDNPISVIGGIIGIYFIFTSNI